MPLERVFASVLWRGSFYGRVILCKKLLGQAASIKKDEQIVAAVPKDLPLAFTDVRVTAAVGARILIDPEPHVWHRFTNFPARG